MEGRKPGRLLILSTLDFIIPPDILSGLEGFVRSALFITLIFQLFPLHIERPFPVSADPLRVFVAATLAAGRLKPQLPVAYLGLTRISTFCISSAHL
jgi:hypothetical protein